MFDPADPQQATVYAAENSVPALYASVRATTKADVVGWLERIRGHARLRGRFPKAARDPFQVTAGRRGERHATGAADGLRLPPWALRRRGVVLHELAHLLVFRSDPRVVTHGPEFCAALLFLVGRYMGAQVRRDLAAAFRRRGVVVAAPARAAALAA